MKEKKSDSIVTSIERRTVVSVDDRGRISLARFGIKNMSVVVDELSTGGVSIQPAVVMTEAEAAHYRNPAAVAALEAGLGDANAGRISKGKLKTI